ncbi:acyltransferase family protein [Kushneria sp. AK178]
MSSGQGERIPWIDVAKGFCIFAVVMYHFNMYVFHAMPTGTETIPQLWQMIISALKPLRMPLFFLISGYLANGALFCRDWPRVRTPKVAMLLWVFAIWTAIYWSMNFLLPSLNPWYSMNEPGDKHPTTLLINILTGRSSLWYLYALALYFLMTRAMRKSALLTFTVAVFFAQAFIYVPEEWWNYASMARYFIFFVLGAYFKPLITQYYRHCHIGRMFFMLALMLSGMVTAKVFYEQYVGIWRAVMGIVTVLVAIDIFAFLSERFCLHWLKILGQRTLPIYVLHMFFIYFCAAFMPVPRHVLLQVVEPVAMPIFVVIGSLFVYHMILAIGGRTMFAMPHTVRRAAYKTGLIQPS